LEFAIAEERRDAGERVPRGEARSQVTARFNTCRRITPRLLEDAPTSDNASASLPSRHGDVALDPAF
jgi:hypothetical protein